MRKKSNLFVSLCNYFCLSIISVLAISCSKEYSKEYEAVDNLSIKDTNHITESQAVEMSLNIVSKIGTTTRSKLDCIGEVYPWLTSDICNNNSTRSSGSLSILPDTLLYIVNFKDNNGYVLVSTDKRLGDIIAVTEKGNINPQEKIDNPGLALYLQALVQYMADKLQRYDSLNPSIKSRQSTRTGNWVITRLTGPIVHTDWHQKSPYNDLCPLINGQRAKAGCIPIAAGQILAYHQHPNSHNGGTYLWDEILSPVESPGSTAGRQSVAKLIRDLGSCANISYGLNASGGYLGNFINCFEDFGYQYTYPTTSNYSMTACINDIENGRPIGVTGRGWAYVDGHWEDVGHAWVVSGVMEKERDGDVDNYEDYIYCNWGWANNDDGFFLSGEYSVNNCYATFYYGFNFIYGITPVSSD